MTLVVEDGTGKADADSYASIADADAHNAEWVGSSAWSDADPVAKERALRRAARFVDSHSFLGARSNRDQALGWPRYGLGRIDGQHVANDTVPARVKRAAMEAAIKDAQGESLLPDHDGGTIQSESSKAGGLSRSQTFARPRQAGKTFEAVSADLRPYVAPGSSRSISRALA